MSDLNIIKSYLTNNKCYKQGKTRTPIGIQIHSIGCAQGTAQAVADYWNSSEAPNTFVTYCVDADISGKVLQFGPETMYTWADAGYGNRNLITIEICESDFMKYVPNSGEYTITDKEKFILDLKRGYDTAVLLCADICKRYKWDPFTVLDSGLYLISSHKEGHEKGLSSDHGDPDHFWKAAGLSMGTFRTAVKHAMEAKGSLGEPEEDVKYYRVRKTWKDADSQLGAYTVLENAKAACPYLYSVFDWNGKAVYKNKTKPKVGTQASSFKGLSETVAAAKILELVHDTDKSGILTSVSAAQMILESGCVTTNLSQIANNCFGMKANLSGNAWDGSAWDGKSTVTTTTWEVENGKTITIDAVFRKYPDVETSINDHAAYLLGAMDGKEKRYKNLTAAKDYREAITIIKNGGYATDPAYVNKICSIIERFGLNKYDPSPASVYKVQVGMYKIKNNAVKRQKTVRNTSGYSTSLIKTETGEYQVLCGTFKTLKNAESRVSKLKKKGVDCLIVAE